MSPDDDITPADGTVILEDPDEWVRDQTRVELMSWALARQGAFYRWCGKGEAAPASDWTDAGLVPPPCLQLYDCSGFVVDGLIANKLAPEHWRHNASADWLFHNLAPVSFSNLAPMDLAFWARVLVPGKALVAEHVMFAWGDGRTYGATGGGQHTTSLAIAAKDNAVVRFRSSHMYRPRFCGFRRLPSPAGASHG